MCFIRDRCFRTLHPTNITIINQPRSIYIYIYVYLYITGEAGNVSTWPTNPMTSVCSLLAWQKLLAAHRCEGGWKNAQEAGTVLRVDEWWQGSWACKASGYEGGSVWYGLHNDTEGQKEITFHTFTLSNTLRLLHLSQFKNVCKNVWRRVGRESTLLRISVTPVPQLFGSHSTKRNKHCYKSYDWYMPEKTPCQKKTTAQLDVTML